MPDRYFIGVGVSLGFLVAAFFLSGFHHEYRRWRRERRRGGYLL